MKRSLLVSLCLFVISSAMVSIPSAATGDEQTIVRIHPSTIEASPGQVFNVTICIDNATDLYAWQVIICYRKDVVSALEAFEGPFLKAAGTTIFPLSAIWNDWTDTHGRIMTGCCIQGPVPGVSGSGVLATITFGCLGPGDSVLEIITGPDDSYLLDPDLEEMPFTAEHGYVTVGQAPHDVAVTDVTSSSTEVFAGETVNLTVTSKNVGTTTENYDVTVCYNSHVIGTRFLTNIDPEEETVHHFVWNTSDVPAGLYVLKALASVVIGETNVMNNVYVDSSIYIKPECELSVTVEAPPHLVAGEAGLLKATVKNDGSKDLLADIKLQLFVDDDMVSETTITELETGASEEITYLWTPTVAGIYTIKAYAPPVLEEEITSNNVATETVAVSVPGMPSVQVEPEDSFVYVGESTRVRLCVYDVTDLFAWQTKLCFDSEILQFKDVWIPDGHVFEGASYTAPEPQVGDGYILLGASLIGTAETFNGDGTLCEIEFEAKAGGSSNLQLDKEATFLIDSVLDSVPFDTVDSTINVLGDVIEIVEFETSRTEVYAGWIIEVNVTVRNIDVVPQTFTVTAHFASELSLKRTVSDLPPGEEATLTFYMDTSPLTPYLDITMWAEATIVIGETWAYNNFWPPTKYGPGWEAPGVFSTSVVPDINGDMKIDIRDLGLTALAFGSFPEHQRWNLLADMNQDCKVDIKDLAFTAGKFGEYVY